MELYGAAHFFDTDMNVIVCDKSVSVEIKKGVGIYGTVRCEICVAENKKKNKAKSVYYIDSGKSPRWVLSNFIKHLKTVHKLRPNDEPRTKMSQPEPQMPQDKPENNECCSSEKNELTDSVVFVDEEIFIDVDVVADDAADSVRASKTISKIPMSTQLPDQINIMMQAVLQNSDKREDTGFMINNSMEKLIVAQIPKDGNCLFSALAHQLSGLKVFSKLHKTSTRQLRKRVVNFILRPANFPKFLHNLKNRVYETKTKDDIENIETECKLWVKLKLAKNGTWGGTETIYAVAELEKVNVVIFNEHGNFYTLRNANQYDRTICIAYRLQRGKNGEIMPGAVFYHYDSVCDIESSTLYDAAKILECRPT